MSEATALGADIRLGVTVKTLHDRDAAVDVEFTDGSRGRYDLVVGADGTYSNIRELVFGNVYVPRFSGQGCWRFSDGEVAGHGLQRHVLWSQQGRADPADAELHVHVPDHRGTGQPPDAGGSPA